MPKKEIGIGTGCGIWFALVCILFWIGILKEESDGDFGFIVVIATGIFSFWLISYANKKGRE